MEVLENTEALRREENHGNDAQMQKDNLINLESGLGFLISLLDQK